MTGAEFELAVSFLACGVAIPIIVVGEMRRAGIGQGKHEPQRKADESLARVRCAPRPRLGIDVAPIHPPIDDAPRERLVDVINGRTA